MEYLHCTYITKDVPGYINANQNHPPSHQDGNRQNHTTYILFGPSFIKHNSFPNPDKFVFFTTVFMDF